MANKDNWSDLQLKFDIAGFEDLDPVDKNSPERAKAISEAGKLALEARDGLPGWMSEYTRLLGHGWPWRIAAYISWASSPKLNREPATLGELATTYLALSSPRVIYTWRERYPAIDIIVATLQVAPLLEHRADIIDALITSASTADYKNHPDRKLALEMLGDYVPRSKLDLKRAGISEDLSEYSDDELAQLAGKLREVEADNG